MEPLFMCSPTWHVYQYFQVGLLSHRDGFHRDEYHSRNADSRLEFSHHPLLGTAAVALATTLWPWPIVNLPCVVFVRLVVICLFLFLLLLLLIMRFDSDSKMIYCWGLIVWPGHIATPMLLTLSNSDFIHIVRCSIATLRRFHLLVSSASGAFPLGILRLPSLSSLLKAQNFVGLSLSF